MKTINIPGG